MRRKVPRVDGALDYAADGRTARPAEVRMHVGVVNSRPQPAEFTRVSSLSAAGSKAPGAVSQVDVAVTTKTDFTRPMLG